MGPFQTPAQVLDGMQQVRVGAIDYKERDQGGPADEARSKGVFP